MKKRHYLLLVLLFTAVLSLLWIRRTDRSEIVSPNIKDSSQTNTASVAHPATVKSPPQVQIPAGTFERLNQLRIDPDWDFKREINFFGKVIDENDQPVVGASINFAWSNAKGEPLSASAISDAAGLFSLKDARGKVLQVRVQKDGYYPVKSSNQIAFEYAEPSEKRFYVPNPQSPVTFYLRKRGGGSELITSQYGVIPSLRVESPSNGLPVAVNLLTRSVGGDGQLVVQGWKEPKSIVTGRNNWAFRLSIPDGGLIEHDDEFPFEAPETGYQPAYEWRFEGQTTNWQTSLNKNFYVKFGSPPRYGRIHLTTTGFSPSATLNYAINPTGSRDLEFASPKQSKPTVFE